MSVKRFCDRCGKEANTCDFSVLHVDDLGVTDCRFRRVDETPAERVARWVAALVCAAVCMLAPVALLAGLVRFIVWCATGM